MLNSEYYFQDNSDIEDIMNSLLKDRMDELEIKYPEYFRKEDELKFRRDFVAKAPEAKINMEKEMKNSEIFVKWNGSIL